MIYTSKDKLAVLELSEERELITFEELFPILCEQPSNVVYIEVQGVLYGIVTRKRIAMADSNAQNSVRINKEFKFVQCGEYIKAKRFFEGRTDMGYLPVVTPDGQLLGEYRKCDELTYLECFMSYSADQYVSKSCKDIHRVVLIKPNSCFVRKQKLLHEMKNILESNGVAVEVAALNNQLEFDDIIDTLLFVDETELDGFRSLCHMNHKLAIHAGLSYKMFISPESTDVFKSEISEELKQISEKGVHILAIHFAEDKNGYYHKLTQAIHNNCNRWGIVGPGPYVSQKAKKEFFGSVYNEEYEKQWFAIPYTIVMKNSVPSVGDMNEPLIHAQHGERLTIGQPAQYERCIYTYGQCIIFGSYVEDRHTIASCLQDHINNAGISCKVVNRGVHCSPVEEYRQISSTSLKKGDIIVLYMKNWSFEQLNSLNLINTLQQNSASASWFVDLPVHSNYIANKLYADAIFEKLFPLLSQPVADRDPVQPASDLDFYFSTYFSDFDPSTRGVIGAIVMNCNPFTLGHRWLIEEARKRVDFLIIFVVEEDRSIFTFEERFAMVYNGVSDLDNIKIVPSGEHILSHNTFPEYFIKKEDENIVENVENDITIFAEKIASKLNISCRFVGEEPEDSVTNLYNLAMKKILPIYGIRIVEIPRRKTGKEIISGSLVRKYLETNDQMKLSRLVPQSTMKILYSTNE